MLTPEARYEMRLFAIIVGSIALTLIAGFVSCTVHVSLSDAQRAELEAACISAKGSWVHERYDATAPSHCVFAAAN